MVGEWLQGWAVEKATEVPQDPKVVELDKEVTVVLSPEDVANCWKGAGG